MDVQDLLTDLIDIVAISFIVMATIDFVMPLVLGQEIKQVEYPQPSVFDLSQELEQSDLWESQEMEITQPDTCQQSPTSQVTPTMRSTPQYILTPALQG